MSTCPASCTGTCPEIVPVTINQTTIDFGTEAVVVDYTGTGDGANQVFDLGAVALEILLVAVGSADQNPALSPTPAYTLDITNQIITFAAPPALGENVHVKYLKEV